MIFRVRGSLPAERRSPLRRCSKVCAPRRPTDDAINTCGCWAHRKRGTLHLPDRDRLLRLHWLSRRSPMTKAELVEQISGRPESRRTTPPSSWTDCWTRCAARSARASTSRSAGSARSRCASAAPAARAIRAAAPKCMVPAKLVPVFKPSKELKAQVLDGRRPAGAGRPARSSHPTEEIDGFREEAQAQEDRDAQAKEATAEESP